MPGAQYDCCVCAVEVTGAHRARINSRPSKGDKIEDTAILWAGMEDERRFTAMTAA